MIVGNGVRETGLAYRDRRDRFLAWVDRQLGFPRERRRGRRDLGYAPDLRRPVSFNEKVIWRKLFDRNPLFPRVADKWAVRDYLRERLGTDIADQHLLPLHARVDKVSDIGPEEWPRPCVVKPTQASGRVLFLSGGDDEPDAAAVRQHCRRWLQETAYGAIHHEWAYSRIRPRLVVEHRLDDGSGGLPADYKFFVFHGRVQMVHVDVDRFQGHRRAVFDQEWNPLPFTYAFPGGGPLEKPDGFERMQALAEAAAAPFDFMRVDLFNLAGRIYFGELTCYPESGRGRIAPVSWDRWLGSHWQLP